MTATLFRHVNINLKKPDDAQAKVVTWCHQHGTDSRTQPASVHQYWGAWHWNDCNRKNIQKL